MAKRPERTLDHRIVELDGIRYVIIRQTVFDWLCHKARVSPSIAGPDNGTPADLDVDRASLAEKLGRRRRAAGLSQVELARRANVRAETLNRIERGRTTPDFATVRKLVEAMNAAEHERVMLTVQ